MLQEIVSSLKADGEAQEPLPSKAADIAAAEEFIPNFCRGEMVLNVVIMAQFLAIVFTIVSPPLTPNLFTDLFLISLFVQWIALMSVSGLCLTRPYLNRLSERRALLMAYLLLLCVTWLVGEFSLWMLATFGYISSARPDWYGYFHAQNLVVSAIINAFALRYFVARHQLRLKAQSEERARGEILRQRIRPHFLFNSMNIIASLTQRAPSKAESAIEDMSELFRLMLDDSKDLVSVHNEIKVARKYIKLEKLRLEQRLNVHWDIGPVPRAAKTPVLMLQLLLEMAVHYGIEQLPDGGDINVSLRMEPGDRLAISVTSPLPGDSADEDPAQGAALDNIRLRLSDHFGDAAFVGIERKDELFRVNITHPALGVTYEDTGS